MKHLLTLALLCLPALAQSDRTSGMILGPAAVQGGITVGNASNMFIQAATNRIGYKFYAQSASPIDAFDVIFTCVGSMTGITLRGHIETDASDAPSGTTVGTETSSFSAPANGVWKGLQTLAADTGALTINAPYWLVITDGGGTAPTASNYPLAKTSGVLNGGRIKRFDGTSWGTANTGDGIFVLRHTNGQYIGTPFSASQASSTTLLYSTTKEGVRFAVGSTATLRGVNFKLGITGSPAGNFEIDLKTGSDTTPIATISIPLTSVLTGQTYTFSFATPQTLTAGQAYYLIAHQASDGGSASNYYMLYASALNSTYASAAGMGSGSTAFTRVSGTSTDPSALTVSQTSLPMLLPLIGSLSADLSGGGGAAGTVIY